MKEIAITSEIQNALSFGKNCVVAIGVSGGKDSSAVALATVDYLRGIAFEGEILLIHSDLGKVEWKQSLPKCQEMASHLGVELIVVKRKAGGMLERWQGRWKNNVARYENLECVKVILPWSTASMRFCTSELKTAPICSELKKRYNGKMIVNVIGIRREESSSRAKKPVSAPNGKLKHKTVSPKTGMATDGYDWNPIIEWSTSEVFEAIAESGLQPHEAYTKYGMSRVSCAFCILSNQCDLASATRAEETHQLYREQVDLEIKSTFSFQAKWLGDVNPSVLSADQRESLASAKEKAAARVEIESRIPESLLFTKGWPNRVPSQGEAEILAGVRREVGDLLGIKPKYTTAGDVIARYEQLIQQKDAKLCA